MTDGFSLPPRVGPAGVPAGVTPGDSWATAIQQSPGPLVTSQPSDDPLLAPVFMGVGVRGGGAADDTPRGFGSEAGGAEVDSTRSIDSLLQDFEKMRRHEQRRLALLLTIAGYAGSVSLEDSGKVAADLTLNEVLDAYNELLMDASGRYARGQKITPEGLLSQNVAYRLPKGADWDGSFSGLSDVLAQNGIDVPTDTAEDQDLSGTRKTTSSNTQTSTSVSRDIMDPNDAMALTRAMLQRELGRDPTKGEFEDFVSAVQAAQVANPTRTRSTTTRDTTNTVTTNKKGRVVDSDTDTNLSTSSTTHGGITQAGIEDVLLRKARANPDWAEWQAVGTYAPALFQALGATVPGV